MKTSDNAIALPTETGILGVYQLKRLWSRIHAARQGEQINLQDESHLDYVVINALGLGLEQTQQYLFQSSPSFDEFEKWILNITGGVDKIQISRINAAVCGTEYPDEVKERLLLIEKSAPVLSEDDLKFWEENGYVILHEAVPAESCKSAEQLIWNFIDANPDEPESWYKPNDHGIMLQLFQHQALTANRNSPRIHKAFSQLWGTADLWVSTDRCGFNVPERDGWRFRGPDLHWDVSIQTPIPFGTQGILYLTDTPPEQGAFTCVPGFQNRIEDWLKSLPVDVDPRCENLHALGSMPIAGKAGDLIIWHQALPHGSSPNRGKKPRIVQYINMYPTHIEKRSIWK